MRIQESQGAGAATQTGRMRTVHQCYAPRNAPQRFTTVEAYELVPCCSPNLAGSQGRQREQTERQLDHRVGWERLSSSEYFTFFVEVHKCRLTTLDKRHNHPTARPPSGRSDRCRLAMPYGGWPTRAVVFA
jgi:hypothetical protein